MFAAVSHPQDTLREAPSVACARLSTDWAIDCVVARVSIAPVRSAPRMPVTCAGRVNDITGPALNMTKTTPTVKPERASRGHGLIRALATPVDRIVPGDQRLPGSG